MGSLIDPYSGEALPDVPALQGFTVVSLPDENFKMVQVDRQIWVIPAENAQKMASMRKSFYRVWIPIGIVTLLLMLLAYINHFGPVVIATPFVLLCAINLPLQRRYSRKMNALKESGRLAGSSAMLERTIVLEKIIGASVSGAVRRFYRSAALVGYGGTALSLIFLLVNMLKLVSQPPQVPLFLLCLLLVATAYISLFVARIAHAKLREAKA